MAGRGGLVGRERERRVLDDAVARARAGSGSITLIAGEAGAGKSILLADAEGRADGCSVFNAAGHSIDRDRPFGLLLDAFAIHAAADPERAAIARAFRADPPASSGPGLLHRIADDLADLIEREATHRPVLLLLDDLQWADEATLLTVHRVARRIDHLPVAIIGAFRPVPRPQGLDELDRLAGGIRLRLQPLAAEDVAVLARNALGAEPGPRLSALLAGAGGNPFYVTELLTTLRDEDEIRVEQGTAESVSSSAPKQLSVVVLRRLGSLSRESVRVLQSASILGTSFAARDLALVLGMTPGALAETLEEPQHAGVIVDDGERLRFRHDLVREALYDDLSVSVRAALHQQFAAALAGAGARAQHVAAHYAAASPFGDADAIDWLRRAARESANAAPASACAWLSKAMELVPSGDVRADQIVEELCPLLVESGQVNLAESLAREALGRQQPPERRQALTFVLAWALDAAFRCLDAAALLEAQSAAHDLTEATRIRLATKALEYRAHLEAPNAAAIARSLLPIAERVGDHVALSEIMETFMWAAAWRGECVDALAFAERADEHSRQSGGAGKPHLVARHLLDVDRGEDALAILREDLRVCEQQGRIRRLPRGFHFSAMIEWWLGRWDSAVVNEEAAAHLAQELFPQSGGRIRQDAMSLLAMIAARSGRREAAVTLLAQRPTLRTTWLSAWADATVRIVSGDREGARDVLRDAWQGAQRAGLESDLLTYGPDLVRLEMQTGDADRARDLAAGLRTVAGRARIPWVEGAALLCEGLSSRDADALVAAAKMLKPSGRRVLFAAAAEDAGAALAAAGRTDEAVDLLRGATAAHEESGAAWDLARVEAALRGLGVRRGKRGARARPATGWESLTDTERRVAELAGEGLTNAETGARLFISGRTVERHLTHVYAKLGISSRVELAAQVARASPS